MILNTSISMAAQMADVVKLGFLHLYHAQQLVPYLYCPDLATVIHRLDLCVGLPLRLTWKLQLVQNAAVWVFTEIPHREHITQFCTSYTGFQWSTGADSRFWY